VNRAVLIACVACFVSLPACSKTGISRTVARAQATPAYPRPWPTNSESSRPAPPPPRSEPAPRTAGPPTSGSPRVPLVAASPQPASFALIVGIERYRETAALATGALNDADRFAELSRVTLGIPERQIVRVLGDRATKADIESAIARVSSQVTKGSRVYFFFSGHGAPDAASGAPFLLPYDGNPQWVQASGLRVSDVIATLGRSGAREVVAMVDTCFSGAGGRSVLPPGTRPLVRVKPVEVVDDVKPKVALFAASGADEISGAREGVDAGLFTSYLVEGLGTGSADADGDGQITLRELSDWVTPRVAREARRAGRAQTPTLIVASPEAAASLVVAYGYSAGQ
jgi:hypothetical protein